MIFYNYTPEGRIDLDMFVSDWVSENDGNIRSDLTDGASVASLADVTAEDLLLERPELANITDQDELAEYLHDTIFSVIIDHL